MDGTMMHLIDIISINRKRNDTEGCYSQDIFAINRGFAIYREIIIASRSDKF